jgi:hypothetical protein
MQFGYNLDYAFEKLAEKGALKEEMSALKTCLESLKEIPEDQVDT